MEERRLMAERQLVVVAEAREKAAGKVKQCFDIMATVKNEVVHNFKTDVLR